MDDIFRLRRWRYFCKFRHLGTDVWVPFALCGGELMEANSMQVLDTVKIQANSEIDAHRERLVDLARKIHADPELAMQEYKACGWLTEELTRAGLEVETGIAGLETAFRATCPGRAERPRIAILAEYDALAGMGHACGHSLIAASAVGVVYGLRGLMSELDGTLVVLGTPGEEGGGGKIILIDGGEFEDLDVAMMIHPGSKTMIGKRSLAVTDLDMSFTGKAAHAAVTPEKGINALDAVIGTFNHINALRQHVPEDVRIHGIITDGGAAANVVPETAAARFIVRTIDQPFLPELLEKVKNCARASCLATGAEVAFCERMYPYDAIKLNAPLDDLIRENMIHLGLEVEPPPERGGMGSTDMGNVSQVLPASHPGISIGPRTMAGHSREMRAAAVSERGFEGMLLAAKTMAMTVIDLLTRPEKMAQVKEAFEEK